MPYADPDMQRAAQRASAKRRREKINQTVAARRSMLRAYVRAKKDQQPCSKCGIAWPAVVLDFHHVRGPKLFRLAEMPNRRRTIEEIDAEIAKCVLLCANCHRLEHCQEDVL
jgi:hypothetical protein